MLIPRLDKVFIYTCNGKYSRKDIKRFISKIKINLITGCWEWIGCLSKKGYGYFSISKNNKEIRIGVHRVAYEMAIGIMIPNNMEICHQCDNRKCVNISHLRVGTHQDNVKDMINRNRQTRNFGENNGHAKLTWIIVDKIRKLYATGKYSYKTLAKMFGINKSTLGMIIRNEIWTISKE
jgi:YesN/AraC family two-component response regulator